MKDKGNSRGTFKNRPRANERIRVKKVKVIGPDGNLLGVMPTNVALQKAYDMDLDLVEIAPRENPPICKIIDYGKYLYDLKKKEKEAKKKQMGTQMKEIRFTSRIGEHDYQVKLRHIREFLQDGHRVRISVRFRGREITHKELGQELLEKLIEDTKDISKVDRGPKMEGRFMTLQLVPAKKK
ncbi:translation initiation factor IF-3 [bacterium]|nr:MAG: translation initiation factor IF-3 [bacterium]